MIQKDTKLCTLRCLQVQTALANEAEVSRDGFQRFFSAFQLHSLLWHKRLHFTQFLKIFFVIQIFYQPCKSIFLSCSCVIFNFCLIIQPGINLWKKTQLHTCVHMNKSQRSHHGVMLEWRISYVRRLSSNPKVFFNCKLQKNAMINSIQYRYLLNFYLQDIFI